MEKVRFVSYAAQREQWPASGRHVMAQFDEGSIIVYQAYRPTIGRWAAEHGQLGGPDFSYGRMSWIKPNFLWMMYRSGWGGKDGQEVTLALRLERAAFDDFLAAAVHSSYVEEIYGTREAWSRAVAGSDVRLQWDPDHGPGGQPLERRAIQLGLRGAALERLGRSALLSVEDLSDTVREQRERLARGEPLLTPAEAPYPVRDAEVARRLGVVSAPGGH